MGFGEVGCIGHSQFFFCYGTPWCMGLYSKCHLSVSCCDFHSAFSFDRWGRVSAFLIPSPKLSGQTKQLSLCHMLS